MIIWINFNTELEFKPKPTRKRSHSRESPEALVGGALRVAHNHQKLSAPVFWIFLSFPFMNFPCKSLQLAPAASRRAAGPEPAVADRGLFALSPQRLEVLSPRPQPVLLPRSCRGHQQLHFLFFAALGGPPAAHWHHISVQLEARDGDSNSCGDGWRPLGLQRAASFPQAPEQCSFEPQEAHCGQRRRLSRREEGKGGIPGIFEVKFVFLRASSSRDVHREERGRPRTRR